MSTITQTKTTPVLKLRPQAVPPDLEPTEKFSKLKAKVIKPENYEKVKKSWKRLLVALKEENERIASAGPSYVPSINWQEIKDRNGQLPKDIEQKFRERGCILIRNVVSTEQAQKWYDQMNEYVQKHPEISGTPEESVNFFNIFWTEGQVQSRSHPDVSEVMKFLGTFWYADDEDTLIDPSSQIAYIDRFRIRPPGKAATLDLHLDSGSIERWEDDGYRSVYDSIFEGNWEDYEPFKLDARPFAKEDLYADTIEDSWGCSCFRAFQGWMALTDNNSGEGTLRVLPNLKLVTAYIMLRPFFWKDDGELDTETPKFPGTTLGTGSLYPSDEFYPHLEQFKSVVSIPNVRRGDYVFWHCDVAHEVDKFHPGKNNSSVTYYPEVPLCPYNIDNLVHTRECFDTAKVTRDMGSRDQTHTESQTPDHGARIENVLSDDGKRALGLKLFDENESGLTPGQKKVREMANKALLERWPSTSY